MRSRPNCKTRSGGEITTGEIGEIIMDKLRKIDAVSYVRFASVYREFKDAETFMEELKRLGEKP